MFAELILLPTRMVTSSGSLMVSRLIEFLFRKFKAFHYFQWLKCNALSTEQLIMRLFTTRANMWLYVDEYLITHMHVCVCVCACACLGHCVPISRASSINEHFSQCAVQQMQLLLLLCSFNFTRSFGQIFNQHTPQTRLATVRCCPKFSQCTSSSWINYTVAAQCAAIWSAHNMQINSNNKHSSAGRTD